MEAEGQFLAVIHRNRDSDGERNGLVLTSESNGRFGSIHVDRCRPESAPRQNPASCGNAPLLVRADQLVVLGRRDFAALEFQRQS